MASADVRVMSLSLLVVVVVAIAAASGAMMTASASDLATDCKDTLARDKDCGDALFHAVFSGNSDLVSVDCCRVLACVKEPSCVSILRTVCGNKWNERCDSPPPAAVVDAVAS